MIITFQLDRRERVEIRLGSIVWLFGRGWMVHQLIISWTALTILNYVVVSVVANVGTYVITYSYLLIDP